MYYYKTMSRTVKIINLIVFCVWITLIAVLLYKNYTGVPLEKAQAIKESFDKNTYWYDIYFGSKKIGFARTDIEKAGDEIIITDERKMDVIKETTGKEEKAVLIEKLRCLCDSYYSIKSFEYTSHFKGEKGLKVSGEVDSESIIFYLESPEKRKTYKTSTGGRNFHLPVTVIPTLHQKNPSPNTTFLIPMLNFINLSVDDMKVVLEEIRPIKVRINILSLYKFRTGNSILWSNEKGIIMKEEYPSGLTLYLQPEDIAKDPADRILFDYTSLPFLKSNKLIPDTEKLNFLKIKIEGYQLDSHLYENSLVTYKNNVLLIEKEDMEKIKEKTYTLPYKNDTLGRYLDPDEWVLSTNKTVQANAHNFAVIEKNDAFRIARYLNSSLYFTVRSMPMFVLSNSMDIFKSHSGDYLERTVMFASFARASGLPTRLVGGMVYKDGYFYFHTWPEVWFDKWIPVDPTLAQFPADVTHIPLKEGTLKDIISILNDLKNIKIEILEAS